MPSSPDPLSNTSDFGEPKCSSLLNYSARCEVWGGGCLTPLVPPRATDSPRARSASPQRQWRCHHPRDPHLSHSSPSLLTGRNTVLLKAGGKICHSDSLEFFHLTVPKGLCLSGCATSPLPPFGELTCPKRYGSIQTHSLSVLKRTKIIPSPLLFILIGNAAPQATFNNSSQQPFKSRGDS